MIDTIEPTVDQLLERVQWIAPTLRDCSAEADQSRRLPDAAVRAMIDAGLYRMALPRTAGGYELDPVSSFRVGEEVARHDSAAGWNLNLATAAEYLLPWLPDVGASEILDTPDLVLAVTFNPSTSQAVPVTGGFQLSGQWRFTSGCHAAKWMLVLAALANADGTPKLDGQGNPSLLLAWISAGDAEIVDTWHTIGMRGTGSNDIRIHDLFVPDRRTAALAPLEHWGSAFAGPLYRLTIWPAVGLLVPPALGLARAAIDEFLALATIKTPSFTGSGVAHRQVVQRQVAQAEAQLRAGRAYFYATFDDAWKAALDNMPMDSARKQAMQLASTHAVVCCAEAVDLIYAAAGSSSIRDECSLQRHFRDIHTISQHAFISAQRYESVGALMLGSDSDWGFFAF
jgi:alkylation response protein AidB-like acyl-CoA dehydrogenase